MNFTYANIIKTHRQINSLPKKLATKGLVFMYKALLILGIAFILILGFFGLGMVNEAIACAPSLDSISIAPVGYQTTIYDSDGNVIETLEESGSNRISVELSEVPEYLQWAFIDTEDERFYQHDGIDLKGILRAGISALTTGSFSGGGASTITQQLLKNNVFENGGAESNNGALIKRKIQEQYLAVQIEKLYTKEIILENYLNTINLGSGCYGVQAAAQRYFNKDVSELTISEAAVIAGITQNPYKLNPITRPENNAKRRELILKNMLDNGHITREEYDEAMADDVYSRISEVNTEYSSNSTVYSYFVDALIDEVVEDLQEAGYTYTQAINAIYSGGLSIYSTQDSAIQAICDEEINDSSNYVEAVSYSFDWAWSVQHADGTITNYSNTNITYYYKTLLGNTTFKILFDTQEEGQAIIDAFKEEYWQEGDIELGERTTFTIQPQSSFTVIDQTTGYVKAIVGGRGEKVASLSLNRATGTTRQPGSCFKVLAVFGPAMDSLSYTLASVQDDEPYYDTSGKLVNNWWGNYYRGTMRLRDAIAYSANIVAMKTIMEITPQLGYEYLLKFGFTTLDETDQYNQALALGGIANGVTNLELCAAFAAIANEGVYIEPTFYTTVKDYNGKIILTANQETHRVLKESTAFLLTTALHDVVAVGSGSPLNFDGQYIAGKTGTTTQAGDTTAANDYWFAGFTTSLTATVWIGYDENSGMYNTDTRTNLWKGIMQRIHNELGYETIEDPDAYEASWAESLSSITTVEICELSGKLLIDGVCENDPGGKSTITEYFEVGTEPTEYCDCHVEYQICTVSGLIATDACPDSVVASKIYRIRAYASVEEAVTWDTNYLVPDELEGNYCTIHTNG